jgi:hypothetical protein
MNRRQLIKAALAIPVVAALAPLIPKKVSTWWDSRAIDMATPVFERLPRYLRYRITWPDVIPRDPSMASFRTTSQFSDPVAVDGGPFRSAPDHVTLYASLKGMGAPPEGVGTEVEGSSDGEHWLPADDVVDVVWCGCDDVEDVALS